LTKPNDPTYKMPGYAGFLPGTRLMTGHRPRSAVHRQIENDRAQDVPRQSIGQQDPTNAFITGSFSKTNVGDKRHESMWADEVAPAGPTFGIGKPHISIQGLGSHAGGDSSLVSNPQRSHMRLGDGRFTEYTSMQHSEIMDPTSSLTTTARAKAHVSDKSFNAMYPTPELKAAQYAKVAKIVKPAVLDTIHVEMLRKMEARLNHSSANLVRQFRLFDHDKSGTVDFEEFQASLRAFGFNVGVDETMALFGSIDKNLSGYIRYHEFCNHLVDSHYDDRRGSTLRTGDRVHSIGKAGAFGDEHVLEELKKVQRLKGKSFKEYEASALERARMKYHPLIERMRVKFFQRAHDLEAAFRHFDANKDGSIDREELGMGLAQFGFKLSPVDISSLMSIFDADKDGAIDIDEFISKLEEHKPEERDIEHQ